MNRREFAQILLLAAFLGCDKPYRRPGARYNLGPVEKLLYAVQFIRDSSLLLMRDYQGWSVMSTRCTKDGCELSFQDQILTCGCCGSWFNHQGDPQRGAASIPLPYYRLFVEQDQIFADTGQQVSRRERFTTPEVEAILQRVRERLATEGVRPGIEVPDALLGEGSDDPKRMFKEQKDEVVAPLIAATPQPTAEGDSMSNLYERLSKGLDKTKSGAGF